MDRSESKQETENAGNVIQKLSLSKGSKKPQARIEFLEERKELHLAIRTQPLPSKTQRYVVVRRPADSTKLVIVTGPIVAKGNLSAAVAWAKKINAKMELGENPNAEKKANRAAERAARHAKVEHNFLAMGRAYIQRAKKTGATRRTLDEYTRILQSDDLNPWHARSITAISQNDIEGLIERVQKRAPVMANRIYEVIRGTLKHAVRTKALLVNPLAGFDTKANLSKESSRKRSLVDPRGDVSELLAVLRGVDKIEPSNHPARALVKLLVLTGLRVGVLARVASSDDKALEWSMVKDLENPELARLEIPPSLRKTGGDDETQEVQLVPAAVAVLNDLAIVGRDTPVFTLDGKTPLKLSSKLRDQYRKLANDAAGKELEHWTPHDLRRSVATGLGRLGAPAQVIDEILDHAGESKKGIRAVYNRSKQPELCREWLQKWADHLEAAARSTPAAPARATKKAAALG
jgi:integrase